MAHPQAPDFDRTFLGPRPGPPSQGFLEILRMYATLSYSMRTSKVVHFSESAYVFKKAVCAVVKEMGSENLAA